MGILAVAATYLLMLLVLGVPFALILMGVSYLLRKRSASTRTAVLVTCATLLFTPGWGPATIVIVPVPFGLLLGVTAISLHWGELIDVMRLLLPIGISLLFLSRRLSSTVCESLCSPTIYPSGGLPAPLDFSVRHCQAPHERLNPHNESASGLGSLA